MPCYHPREAWPLQWPARGITFDRRKAGGPVLRVPCSQCIGCRMARAQDWATRLHHEASLYDDKSFLTLTYSPEQLPDDYSVSVRAMQLFMKRLRKKCGAHIRFFGCGEYGDRDLRPHYHVLIFGNSFSDRTLWRRTASGHYTYRSATLEALWPHGHSEVGEVTMQSAGYVARYVLKKVNGKQAEEHYRRVHPGTGEVVQVKPEFICFSKGIGRKWYQEFSADAFPSDFVVIEGRKRPVPRYYKKQLDEYDQWAIGEARQQRALSHADNNTPERLAVREELQQLRAERLTRELDEGT